MQLQGQCYRGQQHQPPRQHGLPKLVNSETVHVLEGLRQKFGDVQPVHYTINTEIPK